MQIPSELWIPIGAGVGGMVLGAVLGWLTAKLRGSDRLSEQRSEIAALSEVLKSRAEEIERLRRDHRETTHELERLREKLAEVGGSHAALEAAIEKEREAFQEKLDLLKDLREGLEDTYGNVAAKALQINNQAFLDLASTNLSRFFDVARNDFESREKAVSDTVIPIRDALDRYDTHIQAMERAREKAYGGLSSQVLSMIQTQTALERETGKLVRALRVPHVRGRWGEITLKRVAELAGMQNRCDFFEQVTTSGEEGILRPDMIVHLPGNRKIVVDAKVPLEAYLDALEADAEETREALLQTHARHVQGHMMRLSQKSYWTLVKPSPEFVVLFIPGENFFASALSQMPRLIEDGADRGVVLATPTTLIALLKTVAFGWGQETAAENARAIGDLGKELYERLGTMTDHMNRLGKDIDRCATTYNQVVGSLERRVLTSARRFTELGISGDKIDDALIVSRAETTTRKLDPETQ